MSPAEGSARARNGVSPGKLNITSLSHALLAGSKPRVGLTFTGAAGWRSSAVDGGLWHLGPTLCLSSPRALEISRFTNLVELTLLNKGDLSGDGDQGKPGRIIVRDPSPVGDEGLYAALEILITRQGTHQSTVIRPLIKDV